jgi:hypothetical protein
MSLTIKILWGILGLSLLFSMIALATWGIPAPTATITKTLPAEQYLKN